MPKLEDELQVRRVHNKFMELNSLALRMLGDQLASAPNIDISVTYTKKKLTIVFKSGKNGEGEDWFTELNEQLTSILDNNVSVETDYPSVGCTRLVFEETKRK